MSPGPAWAIVARAGRERPTAIAVAAIQSRCRGRPGVRQRASAWSRSLSHSLDRSRLWDRLRLHALALWRTPGRPRHLLWMAATAMAVGLSLPALATIAQAGPGDINYHDEDFTWGSLLVAGATQVEGFAPGADGWT